MENNLKINTRSLLFRTQIIFNFFLVLFYFIIIHFSKYDISESILFSSPDAQQYLNTSTEFFNFNLQGNSITRTFFYPLIILFTHYLLGYKALWLFQFLCWLISVNVLFISIYKCTKNMVYSLLVALIMAINLSFIVLTLHALTEVLTIFLLSLLVFVFAHFPIKSIKASHYVLLITGLLAVTRPVFYYIWTGYLLYHVVYYHTLFIKNHKNILITLLVIFPVVLQLAVMKIKYGEFKLSYIDKYTLEAYLLAQVIHTKDTTISFEEAQIKAKQLDDKKKFMLNNFKTVSNLMLNNIYENLQGYPSLFYLPGFEHESYGRYMVLMNTYYFNLHIIFILPVWVYIFLLFKRKDGNYKVFLFIYAICLYITFTSGISFWQGDRLLITLLPLWLFLYGIVFYTFIKYLQQLIKQKKAL